MTRKVIGTGFSRTGTDSMREALDMLGFGPCHHMHEVNTKEEQKRLRRAFVRGTPTSWDQLFAGSASCVDCLSAHYWPELIRAYTQARVILTFRGAESWWASFEKTIVAGLRQRTDPASLGLTLIRYKVFAGLPPIQSPR